MDRAASCYADLETQAMHAGADLYVITASPYAREEMEANGWRWASQLGVDLYDAMEAGLGYLNANRLLRDATLPYLATAYQSAPYESHPNAAGCARVVQSLDAWLPYATGDDDDDDDDTEPPDPEDPPIGCGW